MWPAVIWSISVARDKVVFERRLFVQNPNGVILNVNCKILYWSWFSLRLRKRSGVELVIYLVCN
jgi:hypothetical protein